MQKQPKHKIGDTVTLTLNNFSWYDEMRIEHKGKFENFESYIIDIKSLQKDEREHVNDQIKEINSKTIIAKILGGYLQKKQKDMETQIIPVEILHRILRLHIYLEQSPKTRTRI